MVGHKVNEFSLGLALGGPSRTTLIARLREQGRIQNYEAEIQHPLGETRNVLASMQIMKLENGTALITTFIDITERVRAEREIRTLASDLTVAEQDERSRISQILHDDLQQRIFAVKMQTSLLQNAYRSGNLQSAEVDFDQLQDLLDKSITITRNLSIDLSPAVLQGEGLADALVWLAAQMQDQYDLQVNIRTTDVPTQFENTVRVLLFQAIREVLFNIVKHAGTSTADIVISQAGHNIQIAIIDNGTGFNAQKVFNESQSSGGLMNIRHRLQLMGCKLHIESQEGRGTRVVIEVPAAQVKS